MKRIKLYLSLLELENLLEQAQFVSEDDSNLLQTWLSDGTIIEIRIEDKGKNI